MKQHVRSCMTLLLALVMMLTLVLVQDGSSLKAAGWGGTLDLQLSEVRNLDPLTGDYGRQGYHNGHLYMPFFETWYAAADIRLADGGGPDGLGTIFYCLDSDLPWEGHTVTLVDSYAGLDCAPGSAEDIGFISGLIYILDHGAPNVEPEDTNWDGAIQATRLAIRTWFDVNGYGEANSDWTHSRLQSLAADSRNDGTASYLLALFEGAQTNAATYMQDGRIVLEPASPSWTFGGGSAVCEVTATGQFDAVRVSSSAGIEIEPASGPPGTTFTVTAPLSLTDKTVRVDFTSWLGTRTPARYGWYLGEQADGVSVSQDLVGSGISTDFCLADEASFTLAPRVTAGGFVFSKTDGNSNPLDGGVFRVLDGDGQAVSLGGSAPSYTWGGELDTFTTSGGEARFSGFPPGSYSITEVSPPTGYVKQVDPAAVSVTVGGTATCGMVNVPVTADQVTIAKTDACTGKPVRGASVEIRDSAGGLILSGVTDEQGELVVNKGLEPGQVYTFAETRQAPGYTLNTETYSFSIAADGSVEGITSFSDDPTCFVLEKTDEAGLPLEGAGFVLYDDSGKELAFTQDSAGCYYLAADAVTTTSVLLSDREGCIEVRYLPVGGYTAEEVVSPAGYVEPQDTFSFVIDSADGPDEPAALTVVNRQTEIVVNKVDAESGSPLAGVLFELRTAGGEALPFRETETGYIYDGEGGSVSGLVTDEAGRLRLLRLPAGHYVLHETRPLPDYAPADDVALTVDTATGDVLVCTVENRYSPIVLPVTGVRSGGAVAVGCLLIALGTGLACLLRRRCAGQTM